jgi:hypothetical protein
MFHDLGGWVTVWGNVAVLGEEGERDNIGCFCHTRLAIRFAINSTSSSSFQRAFLPARSCYRLSCSKQQSK